ncbi:unnamed protein product, partial [Laminaria digitata]
MLSIAFAPMFSWSILAGLAAVALVLAGFGLWRKARGTGLRLLTAAVLLAAMANPVLVEQERILNEDVVAIVVDESASQKIGDRAQQTEEAVSTLTENLQRMRDVDVRVIRAGKPDENRTTPVDGTRLFEDVQRALAGVPQNRIGGTFLITDGQVHDAPAEGVKSLIPGPVHTLLTGSQQERDRRLVIENAPRFGLVGKTVEIEVLVQDHNGLREGDTARVTIVQHGKPDRVATVPVGGPHKISLEIYHAGANIL